MELLRYMLNNILKRPVRVAFVAAAGCLCSAVLVFAFALGTRTTDHIAKDTIAKWTGHLWVSPAEDFEFAEERIGRYAEQARAVRGYLAGHPNTAALVRWLVTWNEIQAGTARQYLTVTATDFEADALYRERTELVAGSFPAPDEEYGLLVTTKLAGKYGLELGDSITVFIPSAFGARNAMDFTVTGIYRASAPWYEDGIAVRVQDYIAMSELGEAFPFYKAYVKDPAGVPAMVRELDARVDDFTVKGYRDDDFVRFLLSLGLSNILFFGFMALILFLALLIGIRSVILTNIFDRREEIGTLRALGFPRATVRNLFFGESLATLFLGYLAGAGAVALAGAFFESTIVRPPLLMLQYMFGMTRMGLAINAVTLTAPLLLLFAILFLTTYPTVGREAEKQAVEQMASR
jgi:ABC-type lipoprotein release transport system permease subunit